VRPIEEKIVPSAAGWDDQPTVPDLNDFHLMNLSGKGNRFGEPHRLTSITGKDRRSSHLRLSHIQLGYTYSLRRSGTSAARLRVAYEYAEIARVSERRGHGRRVVVFEPPRRSGGVVGRA
jgi:hypothetical protein